MNALGIVRALAARGIPTAVVSNKPFDIAHLSRFVTASERVAGVEERPELLVELLERRAAGWRGWALLPTNDESLAALARHHDRLSSVYRLIAPPWEIARHLLDKTSLLESARAVGADIPTYYGPATADTAAGHELSFPVVVKPLANWRFESRFGSKLFVARNREELQRCVSRLVDAKIDGQVVDLVPGPDSGIHQHTVYIDARGEPQGGLTVRKLRQGPPHFGSARVAEVVDDVGGLAEITVELARRMGLRGIVSAEFKQDSRDGSHRFIELNGRSIIYNSLLRRAGLDLAWLAFSDYVLGRPQRARPNGWAGVWINLHADVLYATVHHRLDSLTLEEFLAPYRRRKLEAVWSARDPRPFVTQWSRTARSAALALVSRRVENERDIRRRRDSAEILDDPSRERNA